MRQIACEKTQAPLAQLNNQAMRKQQLTGQILSKKERIRLSHTVGRGFGDELDRTGVRGERPGSCTCSNFQAKSTLFSILPTAALTSACYRSMSMLAFMSSLVSKVTVQTVCFHEKIYIHFGHSISS